MKKRKRPTKKSLSEIIGPAYKKPWLTIMNDGRKVIVHMEFGEKALCGNSHDFNKALAANLKMATLQIQAYRDDAVLGCYDSSVDRSRT